MFEGWSHAEIIQLVSVAVTGALTLVVAWLRKGVNDVHVMINSRLSQLLTGAAAEGQVKERAAADQRDAAKDAVSKQK